MSDKVVCPDCDLLLDKLSLRSGQVALCHRCGALLYRSFPAMIDKTIAFSLTSLIMYIPANILPILTFSAFGKSSTNTMINGVIQLYQEGFLWMAFLVLMTSIIIPLLNALLLLSISFCFKMAVFNSMLSGILLLYKRIQMWALLEVYLLGILIAYVKMIDLGNVVAGSGLVCFTFMLLSSVLASQSFDVNSAFGILDENSKEKHA